MKIILIHFVKLQLFLGVIFYFGRFADGNIGLMSTTQLDLASLASNYGITFTGSADNAGQAVSFAGDVNKDGFTDMLIGGPGYSSNTGRAYLVYGKTSLSSTSLGLMTSSTGIKITGESTGSYAGFSVSIRGDVNGDGYVDMLIGAYGYSSNKGRAYLVYGSSSLSDITLSSLTSAKGIKITGSASGAYTGYSVDCSDVTGDGYADMIIGAPYISVGKIYLLYGGTSLSDISLSSLSSSSGIVISGNGANAGMHLSAWSDLNLDGINDMIIADPTYSMSSSWSDVGRVYVIWGSNSPVTVNLADLASPGTGISIDPGSRSADLFGSAVASGYDLNNDGTPDFAIGSEGYSSSTGRVYVLWGGNDVSMNFYSGVDSSQGITITGASSSDRFGYSVSIGSDCNDDKIPDLVIGAIGYSGGGLNGAVYLIYGGSSLTTMTLSSLSSSVGMLLTSSSTSSPMVGTSVSLGGDINNDGVADFLVGTTNINKAYLIYGISNYTRSPTVTPTAAPVVVTNFPTVLPTQVPTLAPFTSTNFPTVLPTQVPTSSPFTSTNFPTVPPTVAPTNAPVFVVPSATPSFLPTQPPAMPTSLQPTVIPTYTPSELPTGSPIFVTSQMPTASPFIATQMPTTYQPTTLSPSFIPTTIPTIVPTVIPSPVPTSIPTSVPTTAAPSFAAGSSSSSSSSSSIIVIAGAAGGGGGALLLMILLFICWRRRNDEKKIVPYHDLENQDPEGGNHFNTKPVSTADLTAGLPCMTWNEIELDPNFTSKFAILGRGAFGTVIRVRLKASKEVIAVKIVTQAQVFHQNKDWVTECKRLVEEAKVMQKINQSVSALSLSNISSHVINFMALIRGQITDPFVCNTFQIRPGGEGFGIIMKYINGGTLTQLLYPPKDRIPLPLKMNMKIKICAQIAEGLAQLHSINVIHGDMKPDNVLMDYPDNTPNEQFTIYLSDFGLSVFDHNLNNIENNEVGSSTLRMTHSSNKVGFTPLYTAPELFQDYSEEGVFVLPSRSSDLYSLGIILYEVIAQRTPFTTKNFQELKTMVQAGKRPPLDQLPADTPESLIDLIEDLWNQDRKLRPNAFECHAILNHSLLALECNNFDIFFSHAWANKFFLCHVYNFISYSGYKVWYDQNEMGYDLDSSMQNGISNSRIFLVCLDQVYQSRKNCLKELHWAVEMKKEIVVLVLEKDIWSWISPEVKALCNLDHMFVDVSGLFARDWQDENGMLENITSLRQELSQLIRLFNELHCYPSLFNSMNVSRTKQSKTVSGSGSGVNNTTGPRRTPRRDVILEEQA